MSSVSFCRRDSARSDYQPHDSRVAQQTVGRMFAAAYDVPPPNPDIDRLCALLDGHPGRR